MQVGEMGLPMTQLNRLNSLNSYLKPLYIMQSHKKNNDQIGCNTNVMPLD